MATSIQDTWSPLSHIAALGGENGDRPPSAPSYLLLSDQRRIRAYAVLDAMLRNTRREYLSDAAKSGLALDSSGRPRTKTPASKEYREYGDPNLVVDAMRDLVLGEDQTVIVDGPEQIQSWIAGWIDKERLTQKFLQGEKNACGLGDSVYVLGVSERAARPKVRVYDPGMYFPDLEAEVAGWDDEDFPPVVHLLWEYETENRDTIVRRMTWSMVRLPNATTAPWGGTREWTCVYRVEEWDRGDLDGKATVYSQSMGRNGRVIVENQDLQIDFVPVVHVPNTPDEWGTSILTQVAQLIDDLQSADSDLAAASQTANPLLVSDTPAAMNLTGMPGEVLGATDAKYISASLVGQMAYLDSLQKRMAQNTRIGEVLLGRVSPASVPSGFALSLGFHPARQLMRNARSVRSEKYPLIVKFATRLAQAWKWCPAGEVKEYQVEFGSSLPSDLQTAVETVGTLLEKGAISTETAVKILQEAGLPITDAAAEVARILSEQVDKAIGIVDATGDVGAARARLGLEPTTVVPTTATPATDAGSEAGEDQ